MLMRSGHRTTSEKIVASASRAVYSVAGVPSALCVMSVMRTLKRMLLSTQYFMADASWSDCFEPMTSLSRSSVRSCSRAPADASLE
jgi:hypothetical protein